ncbi:MAG: transposase [Desulfuromonadaceae bacterium]|nr:transposase [Desulfuromonadaceae bacterium]
MPRQPRLDIPGLLQHVIVRGIERRKIFRTTADRRDFVDRLSRLLVETDTDCYAWALIPNHFHLLLKPRGCELKHFMRRLLTGYAVNFNNRHNRSGHLFQNRYKSIVCEEDAYLLELIRYIHLNPLRAGLVKNLEALARFFWCGHGVVLGNATLEGQSVRDVLAFFAAQPAAARKRYQAFVADGVAVGARPDLVGGGLRRSCGQEIPEEPQAYDERVLGSGTFVEKLSELEALQDRLAIRLDPGTIAQRVAEHFEIGINDLGERSRDPQRVAARDLFCFIAVRIFGYSGVQVGERLGLQRAAVCRAVKRGSVLVQQDTGRIETILES